MTITNRRTTRGTERPAIVVLAAALLIALPSAASVAAADEEQAASGDFAVLVRGELFTDDLAEARVAHDAVAAGGEEAAKGAGDFYHLAGLSTALLGNTEDSFLGVDRWAAPDAIEAFYSDPAIAEAFGSLFASPPTVEAFARQADWHQWGEMPDPTSTEPRWVAVVRGQLAEADPSLAQAAHDLVAAAGQEPSMAAGDIAHIVYTGLVDPTQFLAFDVWETDANLEAVYGDPDFQAAFQPLFAEPPTLVVYRSTDWHQW